MQTLVGSHLHAFVDGNEDEEMSEYEIEEAHLAESMERLIMEAYKLLQKGDMEQAESLLQEGQCCDYLHVGSSVCSPFVCCTHKLTCIVGSVLGSIW